MPDPATTSPAAGGDATPGALFREGKLDAAIAAASASVRKAPGDLGARILLAELLLFAGNLERADVILDAAAQAEPEAAIAVAEFRQLLRAEIARRQLLHDGRVPEFLGEPTPACRALLAGLVALRAGDREAAARHAAEAEELRPRVPGMEAGRPFDDMRDADDLLAGVLEVLTTTGKYFWIPTERVATAEMHPPRRPRDLAWRRASISVRDGPDGDVYLPALYSWDGEPPADDTLRLGRATDWRTVREPSGGGGGALSFVRGVGQRTYLVGERAVGALALTRLSFGAAASGEQ